MNEIKVGNKYLDIWDESRIISVLKIDEGIVYYSVVFKDNTLEICRINQISIDLFKQRIRCDYEPIQERCFNINIKGKFLL
jgi:hypothetical protein